MILTDNLPNLIAKEAWGYFKLQNPKEILQNTYVDFIIFCSSCPGVLCLYFLTQPAVHFYDWSIKTLQTGAHTRNPGRSLAAWVGTTPAIVSLEVLLTLSLL